MAKLNKPKDAQRQVDQWNARYPVGQSVSVRRDNGEDMVTKTIAPAELLSGHSAVIWLEGVSGCYLLGRVTPLTEEAR
jgi:hypothetical protein